MEIEGIGMDLCYRIGQKNPKSKGRPILMRCISATERDQIWYSRRKLKDTGIYLREDLPEQIEKNVKTLLPILKEAKDKNINSSLNRDVLYLEGEKYTVNSLDNLPHNLRPDLLANVITEQEHFFLWKACKII